MWQRIRQKLQSEKAVQGIVLLGLLGMLCILGSSCFDKSETTAETTEQQQTTYDTMETAEAYCRNLEEKLQQMLSEMEGVGTCDVMITLRSTSSYQYAQDENRSDSDDKTEQKQEHVLIGNGDTEHALVESVESPEIKGVVVVCDGGENNVVKEQVYQVVAAALQIKNSQIYVARRQ